MKTFSHWRLAITLALVLLATLIVALPALGSLRIPLGATFYAVAISAIGLSFGSIIWLYIFQNIQWVAAEKNSVKLIQTVPLIFFTLDKQMQLGRLRSTRFDEFFQSKNLGSAIDFANVIGFLTDAQIRQQACDYVKLLLAQSNSVIPAANPLECVSALMLNSEGRPEQRYFQFVFGNYCENGKFVGLSVAIHDISAVVNARAQLQSLTQKSDQSAQSNVELLIRLIKLDRKTLQDRFVAFENLLDEANWDLKDSSQSGVRYQTLADQVYKKIRLLKTDAAELGLTELSLSAAEMSAELETLGQKAELSGNDFFSVALKLDELYDCLHKLRALFGQLPEEVLPAKVIAGNDAETLPKPTVSPVVFTEPVLAEQASPPGDTQEPHRDQSTSPVDKLASPFATTLVIGATTTTQEPSPTLPLSRIANTNAVRFEFALIQQACIRTAEKLGKKVAVRAQNLSAEAVPDRLKQTLTEILVQLIRSSLANGLELPAARTAAGKDETGTLTMTWTELAPSGHELVFRDDGCGLNFEVIRARAIALNRLTAAQAEALELRQLVGFIFESGFSTSIKASDNSGFGVGLDLVMAAAKRVGGKISVGTQPGLYTQFRVSFPELKEVS